MDKEGADVAEHEDERNPFCLEAKDLVVGKEKVNHAAEDHVGESIDPKWSEEDEKHLGRGIGNIELMFDAEGAEYVATCLPGAPHDEDPGEGFLVEYGLEDVGEGGEAE